MEIEAFVLIGGRSSRFGSDKALATIDGVTLAQRAADTISQTFPTRKISFVARDETQFAIVDLPDIPIIYDIYKDRGAYSALHAALSGAKSEWVFTLACDLPFVSIELLRSLAGFIDKDCDAVAPIQPDGRVQPLCAFYRRATCLRVVTKSLQSEEKLPPLRSIFTEVKTNFVEFEKLNNLPNADGLFLNMNSPVS